MGRAHHVPAAAVNTVRWTRRALVTVGGLVTAYALIGALTDPDVRPFAQLLFLAGVVVAHDAVLLPAAIGLGVLIGRYLPRDESTAVRVTGFITLTLLVVAAPLALGFGRSRDVPSALPLPYGRGLALTVLLIWTATLTALMVNHAITRSQRSNQ
jgi:hypothetical protein